MFFLAKSKRFLDFPRNDKGNTLLLSRAHKATANIAQIVMRADERHPELVSALPKNRAHLKRLPALQLRESEFHFE
jgi:hypothetical protein